MLIRYNYAIFSSVHVFVIPVGFFIWSFFFTTIVERSRNWDEARFENKIDNAACAWKQNKLYVRLVLLINKLYDVLYLVIEEVIRSWPAGVFEAIEGLGNINPFLDEMWI